jgi:phenylacetate-CoA ligase
MILDSVRTLRNLEKTQYLSKERLEDLQSVKLRSVVRHAYDNVKYYREIFDKNRITPDDIKDAGDLYKIPVTSKEDLKRIEPQDILSKGTRPESCVIKYTSGSTGMPLKFFFSPQERDLQVLLNLRILRAAGFRITDKTAYIINPHRFPKDKLWFQQFGILRRYYLSVFDYPEVHKNALEQIRPDIIYGYPSNLTLLAHLIKDKGNNSIKPKAVFSSAELLEPRQRALIKSAMNTEVYDILGLVEIGDIAWECPEHSGYHINSDIVITEFLDSENKPVRPGEEGRLLCTSLYGYTMPLIRYDVGDLCVPSDETCACGRTLPLMKKINGRANDFIILSDGTIIASCFLVIIMQGFHDVAQYRMIQEDESMMVIQLVKGERFNERTPELIKNEIDGITNKGLKLEIEILPEIPRDKSGKIRTVISRVASNYQSKIYN